MEQRFLMERSGGNHVTMKSMGLIKMMGCCLMGCFLMG